MLQNKYSTMFKKALTITRSITIYTLLNVQFVEQLMLTKDSPLLKCPWATCLSSHSCLVTRRGFCRFIIFMCLHFAFLWQKKQKHFKPGWNLSLKSYKNHLACNSWDCVPVSQLIYSQLIYYKIQILSEWNQHIFRIVWMLNLNKWFMADWNNSQSDPSTLNGSTGVSVGSEERRGGASEWCQRRHFTGSDWLLMNLFWPGFGFGPALTYLDSFDWTGLALIHPSWLWMKLFGSIWPWWSQFLSRWL